MLCYLFNLNYDCSGVRQDCNEESITILLPEISSSQIRYIILFPVLVLSEEYYRQCLESRSVGSATFWLPWSGSAKKFGIKKSIKRRKNIWKDHFFKNNKSWEKNPWNPESFFNQFSSFKSNFSVTSFYVTFFLRNFLNMF